jgi:hypothetical protein
MPPKASNIKAVAITDQIKSGIAMHASASNGLKTSSVRPSTGAISFKDVLLHKRATSAPAESIQTLASQPHVLETDPVAFPDATSSAPAPNAEPSCHDVGQHKNDPTAVLGADQGTTEIDEGPPHAPLPEDPHTQPSSVAPIVEDELPPAPVCFTSWAQMDSTPDIPVSFADPFTTTAVTAGAPAVTFRSNEVRILPQLRFKRPVDMSSAKSRVSSLRQLRDLLERRQRDLDKQADDLRREQERIAHERSEGRIRQEKLQHELTNLRAQLAQKQQELQLLQQLAKQAARVPQEAPQPATSVCLPQRQAYPHQIQHQMPWTRELPDPRLQFQSYGMTGLFGTAPRQPRHGPQQAMPHQQEWQPHSFQRPPVGRIKPFTMHGTMHGTLPMEIPQIPFDIQQTHHWHPQ